jgi:hypothetical protein
MNAKKPKSQEALLHTCAWCNRRIPTDAEIFGFGAKARSGVDLADKEGEFISLKLNLEDKTVFAIVTPDESPVRQTGYDFMFITCSQACAMTLKDALDLERDVFEDR